MENKNLYPRVLIVGQSFDSFTGPGITLSHLFGDWPAENLAVVSTLKTCPDLDKCNNYYRLGSSEFYYIWPVSSFVKHRRSSGDIKSDIAFTQLKSSEDLQKYWQDLTGHTPENNNFKQMIYQLDDLIGGEEFVRKVSLSDELVKWIETFKPELIYSHTESIMLIDLINQLYERFKIPIVIHMMDDWPATIYKEKILSPFLRYWINREFVKLLSRTKLFLGISSKMCSAYQIKYRKQLIPFHNPIDLDFWVQASHQKVEKHFEFSLLYRGRVGLAINSSLEDVCDVVEDLYRLGVNIRFDIYITPLMDEQIKIRLERKDSVFVHPPTPYSDIPGSLAAADLLVLCYDFDRESITYIHFSMPTKVSEYMASGTPILVYAPPDTAVFDYAEKEKWGYIVSQNNKEQVKQAIIYLMKNNDLRAQLGRHARELAVKNHDALIVKEEFRSCLYSAVNG